MIINYRKIKELLTDYLKKILLKIGIVRSSDYIKMVNYLNNELIKVNSENNNMKDIIGNVFFQKFKNMSISELTKETVEISICLNSSLLNSQSDIDLIENNKKLSTILSDKILYNLNNRLFRWVKNDRD